MKNGICLLKKKISLIFFDKFLLKKLIMCLIKQIFFKNKIYLF